MSGAFCGCCKGRGPSVPAFVHNRPGLPAISYRSGTYSSFRRSMLDALANEPRLAQLTSRTPDDPAIAVLEMWAYVAEILTFYQERIANEAFVRTAMLRESLTRLADLLGYRPAPGVAAIGYLAFELQEGAELQLAPGLRTQSVPEQDEKPQKFEIVHELDASAGFNAMPLSAEPQPQEDPFRRASTGGALQPPLVDALVDALPVDTSLVLFTEDASFVQEKRVASVTRRGEVTELKWDSPIAGDPGTSEKRAFVYGRKFRLFGHTAPPRYLHQYVASAGDIRFVELKPGDVVVRDGQTFTYDLGAGAGTEIDLDGLHQDVASGTRLLIAAPADGFAMTASIRDASPAPATVGPQASTVTRLTLNKTVPAIADLRTVEIYELGPRVVFWGNTVALTVDGTQVAVPTSEPERLLDKIVLVDDERHEPVIATVVAVRPFTFYGEGPADHAELTLSPGLPRDMSTSTGVVVANVARASHGETVRDEHLGAGDGAGAFQRFKVKKAPLTYVPSPGAPHGAASTLEVRVNGILWHEVQTFFGHAADARVYRTVELDDGSTALEFGDGINGSRLPSGAPVTVRYRQGVGRAGNLPAGSLTTLLDRPKGLRAGRNPLVTSGGAEPESASATRANAPASVRTLERVVSLRDFEDAARESAMVAKARASMTFARTGRVIRVTVAGDGGAEIEGAALEAVVADLDARRDPNHQMRVGGYEPVPFVVRIRLIDWDRDRRLEDVVAAVKTSLLAYFAFDNREFGQPVHASEVLARVQSVLGVVGADLDRLRFARRRDRETRQSGDESLVQRRLVVEPHELATLASDDLRVGPS